MWFLLAAVLLLEDPSQEAAFALLDRFDTLDTAKLPLVKVATGSWVRHGSDPPQNRYRYAFLLEERSDRFTVRYLDLTRQTLKPTPARTPEHERIGYTSQDMGELARDVAGLGGGERYYLSPGAPMDPRGQALLLARACARRGLQSEVEGLWKALGSIPKALDEVGDGLYHNLCLDFADPELSRDRLLERHKTWASAFPDHWLSKLIEPRIKILTRMVAEDRSSKDRPAVTPASESSERLVFQLRDEFYPVDEWFVDGWFVSTTAAMPKDGSRPSDRLRQRGFEAVPALLKAIGDETLTRCVWYSSRYGGSFRILDTGTFAEEILEEITGLRFYGETEERLAEWESWWKLASEKGEADALAEIASRGDHSSAAAGKRLLARWPQRIGDVLAGSRRANNRGVREDLVNIIGGSKEESATLFLLEELRTGPYVYVRVAAARALLEGGRRDGIAVLMKEWEGAADLKERPEPGVPDAVADFDLAMAKSRAREAMAGFLISSGQPEAVAFVGRDLMKQDPVVRDAVLDTLHGTSLNEHTERADPATKAEIEKAIEGIVGQLLDDLRVCNGHYSFPYGDEEISLIDPRAADLAACALVTFWPNRYRYDPVGPARLKDRRLAMLRNTWRERQGLPAIPIPAAPDVKLKEPANVVSEVALDTGDREAPAALRSKVAELKGKPLTSEAVVGLLLSAIEALPDGSGDVLLIADRLGDGTGVGIQLRAVPALGKRGKSVKSNLSVVADGRALAGSYGSGSRTSYDKPEHYQDVTKGIDKALTLPHDKTFEIRLELHLR